MKHLKQFLFFVFALTSLLQSCTIEKRHYRPGYNVEWKHRSAVISSVKPDSEISIKVQTQDPTSEIKSEDNAIEVGETINVFQESKSSIEGTATDTPEVNEPKETATECDYIYLKDGKVIYAKNIIETNELIQYEDCLSLQKGTFQIKKKKVTAVTYKGVHHKNPDVKSDPDQWQRKPMPGSVLASIILTLLSLIFVVFAPILTFLLGFSGLLFAIAGFARSKEQNYKTGKWLTAAIIGLWILIAAMFLVFLGLILIFGFM